jgi:hypothetical protein
MTVDRSHEAANARELDRLRRLVFGLDKAALSQPVPGGWTVASVLAHVAFWDARALYWLDRWAAGAEPASPEWEAPEDVEWINNAAKPLCLALPPRTAADLAMRTAEETDRRVAALGDDLLAKVQAAGSPFNLSRAEHRGEHLDDIERALRSIEEASG